MSKTTTTLCALAASATLALSAALPAHAEPLASTLEVEGSVDAGGALSINETITFQGEAPATLTQRLATTEDAMDRSHYVFSIDNVKASADGTDLAPAVRTDGDYTVIDVDTAKAGGKPITISYVVHGAARAQAPVAGQAERTEVKWRVLQGLSVPVKEVSGTVRTPGTVSFVNCESGPPVALQPCTTFGAGTHEAPQPTFSDGPRGSGEVVQLDFGLPSSVVASNSVIDHKWSLDRAFSVNRKTLLASLLPLLLGGLALWLLHRRAGRDQVHASRVTPVAEFRPVGPGESRFTVLHDVRPGHVGTVADERVDPVDVTATLLDLAVRGWLRIVQRPDRPNHPLDWTFERREAGQGELRGFEARLRDAVAPAGAPGVTVSAISPAVEPVVEAVQDDLYEDVVRRGWFERSPQATRSRWAVLGWTALALAVLATLLLVLFTTYGLVGVALSLLGLGALLVAQQMPRRTHDGSALLGGLSALASQLATQPTNQAPAGQEYAELSRVLPYAVVLGGRERWLQALVDADDDAAPDGDDLDWYHAPETWHLRDLPGSLNAFIVTVQGQLFGR
ncbi:DUF2207 family protein [Luteococcus peritonei]|uniref:DUF2207 family protein n=1 Tax=Luteococcus peritonei TaxID=88874 RepID=A0ABW4RT96_9ACTN